MENNISITKKYSKLSLIGFISPNIGILIMVLKSFNLIPRLGTIGKITSIITLVGFSFGIILGTISFFQKKNNENFLEQRVFIFSSIILGFLGICYSIYSNYVLYTIRQMY